MGRYPANEVAVQVEYADKAQTGAILLVVTPGHLLRVSDVQLAVEVLDVEGCISGRQGGIGEASRECRSAGTRKDINRGVVKVGGARDFTVL